MTSVRYNFSGGIGLLPPTVLEQVREAIRELPGTGQSVLVLDHRSQACRDLVDEAERIAAALEASAVPVDLVDANASSLPPLDGLLEYEATVLVDVAAPLLGETERRVVHAAVKLEAAVEEALGLDGFSATAGCSWRFVT